MKRTLPIVIALVAGFALGIWGTVLWNRANPRPQPLSADPAAPVLSDAAATAPSHQGNGRWLKGQLHAHSSNSGDAKTPPFDVLRWYAERGYDFVVFTDHNHLTAPASHDQVLAIPGVELTQNLETCTPPPEPGQQCLLHVNALFVDPTRKLPPWPPEGDDSRKARFGAALKATEQLGGLAQLNHPNFHYALTPELIAELSREGARFLEVANEAVDSNNAGDKKHPSTERLWDLALSKGARIWGTATDDAHHFYDADEARAAGELAHVGDRGFVMVRANKDVASIRNALERGDFYASSGVLLDRIALENGKIVIEAPPGEEPLHFAFWGQGGDFLGETRGRTARLDLSNVSSSYVRATVTDSKGRKAWTQPFFLREQR